MTRVMTSSNDNSNYNNNNCALDGVPQNNYSFPFNKKEYGDANNATVVLGLTVLRCEAI